MTRKTPQPVMFAAWAVPGSRMGMALWTRVQHGLAGGGVWRAGRDRNGGRCDRSCEVGVFD